MKKSQHIQTPLSSLVSWFQDKVLPRPPLWDSLQDGREEGSARAVLPGRDPRWEGAGRSGRGSPAIWQRLESCCSQRGQRNTQDRGTALQPSVGLQNPAACSHTAHKTNLSHCDLSSPIPTLGDFRLPFILFNSAKSCNAVAELAKITVLLCHYKS